ncbi:MAG: glycosyltransferase family 2 protein [Hormoscilla sp. GM7CHS1pb]|nr:glycosyltransferase family 2 protein [Hormoscilla sp. GM7CHS1pb]
MIYLLIVNYYSTDLIAGLLTSIYPADNPNLRVIIVNNYPEDRAITIAQLAAARTDLILITAETNLGFGAGCNLGIQHVYQANPQALIWLLNPDTTIEPDAVAYIMECFQENPDLAILGTKIRDAQGNIWFSEGRFNPWIGSLPHQSRNMDNGGGRVKIIPCRWVSGCSMILNLARFNHCPKFDFHYFLYYEDNDFCERYYQQGYQIAVTQDVKVTHLVSATTHKDKTAKFRHATYSKLYFLKQHGTVLALGLNLVYMLAKVVLLLPRDRASALGRWQGLQNFILSGHERS